MLQDVVSWKGTQLPNIVVCKITIPMPINQHGISVMRNIERKCLMHINDSKVYVYAYDRTTYYFTLLEPSIAVIWCCCRKCSMLATTNPQLHFHQQLELTHHFPCTTPIAHTRFPLQCSHTFWARSPDNESASG